MTHLNVRSGPSLYLVYNSIQTHLHLHMLNKSFFKTLSKLICTFSSGPPHDLQIQEVRKNSLVLLWKPPVYQGRDAVNGYYIDIKETDADFEKWRGVNEKATDQKYMKVCVCVCVCEGGDGVFDEGFLTLILSDVHF